MVLSSSTAPVTSDGMQLMARRMAHDFPEGHDIAAVDALADRTPGGRRS